MQWPCATRLYAWMRFHDRAGRDLVDCVAQCENLLSIDQAELDLAAGPMGVLDDAALRNVVKAIGYAIESDCEPL